MIKSYILVIKDYDSNYTTPFQEIYFRSAGLYHLGNDEALRVVLTCCPSLLCYNNRFIKFQKLWKSYNTKMKKYKNPRYLFKRQIIGKLIL